ncbi:hypothetical protein N0V85_006478 [Neurospora sp. IMI 360204]|nr:hypothetical protein N0V85_006478 [Neurospora sp. IMI 360204]
MGTSRSTSPLPPRPVSLAVPVALSLSLLQTTQTSIVAQHHHRKELLQLNSNSLLRTTSRPRICCRILFCRCISCRRSDLDFHLVPELQGPRKSTWCGSALEPKIRNGQIVEHAVADRGQNALRSGINHNHPTAANGLRRKRPQQGTPYSKGHHHSPSLDRIHRLNLHDKAKTRVGNKQHPENRV